MEEIDISECKNLGSQNECFANVKIGYCGNFNGYEKCANLSDCYYKQLLRKEKECEEYKQVLQEIKKYCEEAKNGCYIGLYIFADYILQIISEVEK